MNGSTGSITLLLTSRTSCRMVRGSCRGGSGLGLMMRRWIMAMMMTTIMTTTTMMIKISVTVITTKPTKTTLMTPQTAPAIGTTTASTPPRTPAIPSTLETTGTLIHPFLHTILNPVGHLDIPPIKSKIARDAEGTIASMCLLCKVIHQPMRPNNPSWFHSEPPNLCNQFRLVRVNLNLHPLAVQSPRQSRRWVKLLLLQ